MAENNKAVKALDNYHDRLTEVLYVTGELTQSDIDVCREYTKHWLKQDDGISDTNDVPTIDPPY